METNSILVLDRSIGVIKSWTPRPRASIVRVLGLKVGVTIILRKTLSTVRVMLMAIG